MLQSGSMLNYFSKYWFDFVYVITIKEIKARYKKVIFGFLWIIINPLIQMAIIGFVFQFFIPNNIDNYFYFLFAGLLPWNFFALTVSRCTTIILDERSLIQKAKFPREALVLSIVFSNLFHFLVSLLVFVSLALILSMVPLIKIPLLIFAILWLIILILGLSLILSALFVKFRDMKFIVQAIMPLWFYATPIIYQRSLLPEYASSILRLNPMTFVVELFQYIFDKSLISFDFSNILLNTTFLFIIFFTGVLIFKHENRYFDDWL